LPEEDNEADELNKAEEDHKIQILLNDSSVIAVTATPGG
jgi:hypothetical protein